MSTPPKEVYAVEHLRTTGAVATTRYYKSKQALETWGENTPYGADTGSSVEGRAIRISRYMLTESFDSIEEAIS